MPFSNNLNSNSFEDILENDDIFMELQSFLSTSDDLENFIAENSEETSVRMPIYEDPFTDDNERVVIEAFKNRLRTTLTCELQSLERKEILNKNITSEPSVFSLDIESDFRISAYQSEFKTPSKNMSTARSCCESSTSLNKNILLNFLDNSKDYLKDGLNIFKQKTENKEIRKRKPQQSPDLFSQSSDNSTIINGKCSSSQDFQLITNQMVDKKFEETPFHQIFSAVEYDHHFINVDKDDKDVDNYVCLKERKNILMKCIQELIKSLLKSYEETGDVNLLIDNTSNWDNLELREQMLAIRRECTTRNVSISNCRTQFRLTLINFLLNEILKRLVAGVSCTLRELYYQDPQLCIDQKFLTKALNDICCLLHCTPWELGVFSSSKGLIAGSLLFSFDDDVIIDCTLYQTMGFLLPKDTASVEIIDSNADFILLVEKDTVFEKLLQQKIFHKISNDFILITGKGYPDINTRLMLRKILNKFQIPIYALMDADPFGIEIMLIYSHGSKELSFMSHCLACPEIQWIGILPSEIELLSIPSIPLSKEDKSRIDDLFKRPYTNNLICNELNILLELNCKAEIEGISSFSFNYLVTNYIPNKIGQRDFI